MQQPCSHCKPRRGRCESLTSVAAKFAQMVAMLLPVTAQTTHDGLATRRVFTNLW